MRDMPFRIEAALSSAANCDVASCSALQYIQGMNGGLDRAFPVWAFPDRIFG